MRINVSVYSWRMALRAGHAKRYPYNTQASRVKSTPMNFSAFRTRDIYCTFKLLSNFEVSLGNSIGQNRGTVPRLPVRVFLWKSSKQERKYSTRLVCISMACSRFWETMWRQKGRRENLFTAPQSIGRNEQKVPIDVTKLQVSRRVRR